MKRPKSVMCVRPDRVALICRNCEDSGAGVRWAQGRRFEITMSLCPYCDGFSDTKYRVDSVAQWDEAKQRAEEFAKKSFDPERYMKQWKQLNPRP